MITRLFKLECKPESIGDLARVGENNLLTSVGTEEGTLAMYSTHLPEAPGTNYVFEVYADDAAYEVHAASPQFKAYLEMASTGLSGREVFSLVPELLVEKPVELRVTGENVVEPHLVFVDVKEGGRDAFLAAITANMTTSVAEEEGVLVMYAATLADNPGRWVFWEVYASAEAYAAHRESPQFKQYIADTEDVVCGKEFVVLAADTLASKGSLRG